MPTNLYGLGDNYHQRIVMLYLDLYEGSMRQKNNLNEVVVWGTGTPNVSFSMSMTWQKQVSSYIILIKDIYGSNKADAVTHQCWSGIDDVKELAVAVKVVGFEGVIVFDHTKPDGIPRKLMDVSLLSKLGWNANISLKSGLKLSYADFKSQQQR